MGQNRALGAARHRRRDGEAERPTLVRSNGHGPDYVRCIRAPCFLVDLARRVSAQAQRQPDLENAVEDRVDADDVEQRQRTGRGLRH